MNEQNSLKISTRSFVTAIIVIFVLMAVAYGLTFLIPGGEYVRIQGVDGNLIIDTSAGFFYTQGGISFWKWLSSPVLCLTASGGGTLFAVIAFLLIIGGVFTSLESCGMMC